MISGFTAPGSLGLVALAGGALVYSILSTSAMSPAFRFHMRSSTSLRTRSSRESGAGAVGGGGEAGFCAAADINSAKASSVFIPMTPSSHRELKGGQCPPFELLNFGAVLGRRFAAPVLMHDAVLVEIERPAPGAAIYLRISVDLIAGLGQRQQKNIAVLYPFRQAPGNQ